MILELLRREKRSGIQPDEDLDILIKVCSINLELPLMMLKLTMCRCTIFL